MENISKEIKLLSRGENHNLSFKQIFGRYPQSLNYKPISESEGTNSELEGSISATEGSISALEGSIPVTEGNISVSEGTNSELEGSISVSEGSASVSEGTKSGSGGAIGCHIYMQINFQNSRIYSVTKNHDL
jgi:hypothetical protein